jgi:hypothetical protein
MAMPKTGRGISPALMGKCGSPMKQTQDPDLTRKGAESRKKVLADAPRRAADKKDSQGIQVDPTTGKATARPYEKKFLGGEAESSNKKVPTGKSTNARIVDGKGKLVKEAKKGQTARRMSNEDLYREYKSDSTNTMAARNKYARFYNVQAGKEKPTAEETRSGQARAFFAK